MDSPGKKLRDALLVENPLQIVGVIHALCGMMAEQTGFRAVYLSGAGVANASHGLPDLGVTNLNDVVTDAERIVSACSLPLLVDIDTGWGTELTIRRAIQELERAGVAGVHMEDQVFAKRCGHRPGKQLVAPDEMQARIVAACESRRDSDFVIMARTDAVAVEGLAMAIHRAKQYVAAGADMIFAEAIESKEDYQLFTNAIPVPVLANMTEFGKTPYLNLEDFRACGVRMVLYPLTAMRAMNQAAMSTLKILREQGSQRSMLDQLQTREELYGLLNYHSIEQSIDRDRLTK